MKNDVYISTCHFSFWFLTSGFSWGFGNLDSDIRGCQVPDLTIVPGVVESFKLNEHAQTLIQNLDSCADGSELNMSAY